MKPSAFLVVLILLCVSAPQREAVSAELKKPNILFIAIDDMNDWVGCLGGHPDARTPNIGRLAKRGMLFTNGHTAAPVCNPSRAAFLSGIGPWRTGIYHNGDPWLKSDVLRDAILLPKHFRNEGYHTMMAGKIFHGANSRGMADGVADENGGGMGGQSFKVIADDFPDPFKDLKGIHNFAGHWGGLEGKKAAQLSDPKIAAWGAERLQRDYEKPFLLMLGFHRPHTPLTSPKEFWEMFDRETIQLPPIHTNDLADMPWPGRQVAVAGYQEMQNGHYRMFTERGRHRDILRGYLAACAFVDAQVGKVLDALDRGPHRDNTIVVLFSDHGWGVGERYHFKKWGLWDDTTRIPYIIHVPGMTTAGAKTSAGVDLLDLYPTLVDLAGIKAPAQSLDGRSLRPLLENPLAEWKRPALTTFGQENQALRSPRWRYIRWSNGSEELYDHDNDPHEWNNVADVPKNAAVKKQLAKWFPKASVPSVASDHASPVTLTPKDGARPFRSIRPGFVDQPISVKATIGPKITDGVILQHGGMFCGYALYVKDGRLTMSVMDVPRPLQWDQLTPNRTVVTATSSLASGRKLEVEGSLAKDGAVTLRVNGKEVGRAKTRTLSIHPAGVMQLGHAPPQYLPVGDYEAPFRYSGPIESVEVRFGATAATTADLSQFKTLVKTATWTEKWPDDSGGFEAREVTAEIWTAAMQASLDEMDSVHIPARDLPYYIDGPLVLKSGQRLTADPRAEIRLKPGCNTCMVRNANLVGFKDGPVPEETNPDTDIHVEGGIWTTLAAAKNELNGNARGHSSRQNWAFGTHGVILFQNARRISVKNVTVRKSKPFAIHLGNVHEFEIDGLTLEDHYRDGVHVNGPASQGTIRNIRGNSHDDPVALNAWEWKNYAPSYGPIRDVLVENVTGASSGTSAIRLLPGVKRFDDGTELDCPLENITLRRITDIREFKIYDQPNLEMGRDKDFSIGVGSIENLRFEDLVFNRPGKIELHANTDGLVIQNVEVNHPIAEDWQLLAIGPKSQTWNRAKDPARWTEIFSPDLDCTVRNVNVSGVRTRDSQIDLPINRVVKVIEQKLNPDYPKTTPKGGTGKGIWNR